MNKKSNKVEKVSVESKCSHNYPKEESLKNEEKSAVGIGIVLGIAYLLIGALVIIAPEVTAKIFRALTFGQFEIKEIAPDSKVLLIGLIAIVMAGIIGGFLYAKIYNMIKKYN